MTRESDEERRECRLHRLHEQVREQSQRREERECIFHDSSPPSWMVVGYARLHARLFDLRKHNVPAPQCSRLGDTHTVVSDHLLEVIANLCSGLFSCQMP